MKELLNDTLGVWPILTKSWDESKFDITRTAIEVNKLGNNAFFNFFVGTDDKNSTKRVLHVNIKAIILFIIIR